MVQSKMGRYWEQAKRWIVCKVWPFKTKSGLEEEVSESVSHLQKQDQCQKAKEDLPLPGNGQLPMWDLNLQT